jgi:L,D-transpeptidase ErfK/SrfK
MPVTHGCIRLYPEDIAALFTMVPLGTKVYLMNDPVKVAFLDGQLLLEVHPPVDAQGQTVEPELSEFERLLEPLGDTTAAIDWDCVRAALKLANGIPVTVCLEADRDATPGDTHSLSSTQQ